MDQKTKWKYGIVTVLIAVSIIIVLNYALKIDKDTLKIISGGMTIMIPSVLSSFFSNKTNKEFNNFKKKFLSIVEIIEHKEKITLLCNKIEKRTSNIFSKHYEIDSDVKNLIIQINTGISGVIKDQYEYGFNDFDTEYFRRKILSNFNSIFNYISGYNEIKKIVNTNLGTYINEINLIKNLENGTRRTEFEKLTLKLTDKITNHSITFFKE